MTRKKPKTKEVIVSELSSGPKTAAELANVAGSNVASVHTAISQMRRHEGVAIVRQGDKYFLRQGHDGGGQLAQPKDVAVEKPVEVPGLGAELTVTGLMMVKDGIEMVLRNGKKSYLVAVKGETE